MEIMFQETPNHGQEKAGLTADAKCLNPWVDSRKENRWDAGRHDGQDPPLAHRKGGERWGEGQSLQGGHSAGPVPELTAEQETQFKIVVYR